jgi:hypothetical protein
MDPVEREKIRVDFHEWKGTEVARMIQVDQVDIQRATVSLHDDSADVHQEYHLLYRIPCM